MIVEGTIPQSTVEMSRYIDLDAYDRNETYHEHYREMRDAIVGHVINASTPSDGCRILEIGAGTGLLTEELARLPSIHVDALDLDLRCCAYILRKLNTCGKVRVIHGDAVTYTCDVLYDLVVSSFTYDHVPYDSGIQLVSNISNLLIHHGKLIIGTEVIPPFCDEATRRRALIRYHSYIMRCAWKKGYQELARLEYSALVSGFQKIGDFKRSHSMMMNELSSAGFTRVSHSKIGPTNIPEEWGVYIYVCTK